MSESKPSLTFDEIKQKLVNYCVYQDRCHSEVEQKMREFMLIPEAKDALYLYLLQENYLNEERFTRSYIRGKFNIKRWGRGKIRHHLKFKGIPDKLISRCMDEISDEDYQQVISQQVEKLLPKYKGLPAWQKKSKVLTYLGGRGFEYDEVRAVLERFYEE